MTGARGYEVGTFRRKLQISSCLRTSYNNARARFREFLKRRNRSPVHVDARAMQGACQRFAVGASGAERAKSVCWRGIILKFEMRDCLMNDT